MLNRIIMTISIWIAQIVASIIQPKQTGLILMLSVIAHLLN